MIKPTQTSRAAVRSSPYPTVKPTGSILLGADRQSRKRKSLSWQPDDEILKVHYFEYIADERINVTRVNNDQQHKDTNASAINQLAGGSSQNKLASPVAGAGVSLTGLVDPVDRLNGSSSSSTKQHDLIEKEYSPWLLIPIDFAPELPSPGWNSQERTAQAEREQYVLGAIDLPGLPSILDEPDNYNATTSSDQATKEGESAKLIPLESDEGVQTSYTHDNMYNSEIVNGVRISTTNDDTNQQQLQPQLQQHHLQQQQQQQLQQQQLLLQQQQQMTLPNGVWTTPYPWLGIQAATRSGPVEGEIHNLFTRYF